jgi:hypothetical protein
MTCDATIEGAERASRSRAIVMAMAAIVLLINAAIQWGNPHYVEPGVRAGSWIFVIAAWMFILANGGGLRLRGRMRALLNDELSLRNRARALAAGFYTMLAAGLALYAATWWIEIAAGDAIKAITAVGLATALLVYAWLEW